MANIWDLIVKLSGDGRSFRDDLDKDKAALDEFNADLKKISDATAKVKLDDEQAKAEWDEFRAKIEGLRKAALEIDVRAPGAAEKLAALKAEADELRKVYVARISVDSADAKLKILEVDAMLEALGRKDVHPKIKPEVSKTSAGRSLLAGLITAALPAASPLAAAGVAGGMGLASGFAAGGAGGVGFGAVATSVLKPVFETEQQMKQLDQQLKAATTNRQRLEILKQQQALMGQLDSEQKKALQSSRDFGNFWNGYSKQFESSVVDVFRNFLQLLKQGLTDLAPAIKGFASGFSQLEKDASKALGSPFWKSFFSWLGGNAKQSTLDFGHAIGNLIKGFAGLLQAFDPLSKSMDKGLVNLTKRFADWATNLSGSKGFNSFLAYVKETGPQVVTLISQLGQFLMNALKAMAPLGGPTLTLANGILKLQNGLLQANPLIGTFVAFALQSWGISRLLGPFGSMGKSVTGFIPVIEKLSGKSGLVGLFGKGLMGLIPVFKAVGKGMTFIGGPWGILVAAIIAAVALVITHWDTIKKWWNEFVTWISGLWNNRLKPFFNKWGPEILAVLAPFIGVPLIIHQHWDQIRTWLSQTWDKVKSFMAKWGPDILVVLAAFIGIPLKIKQHWDQIAKFFTDLWSGKNGIKSILDGWVTDALNFGKNIVNNIVAGITSAIDNAETKVKQALGKLGSWLGIGGSSSTPAVTSPTSQLPVSPGVASMVSGASGTVNHTGTINVQVQHTGGVKVDGMTPKAVQQVNQALYTQTIRNAR